MRKLDGCRLIDELEIPLKGFENFHQVASHIDRNALGSYLDNFVCPQPGDWPSQFFMRKVQLHGKESGESVSLQYIVPFIGPLHIQLNARESVCVLNINIFRKAYYCIFGSKKVLAKNQKPGGSLIFLRFCIKFVKNINFFTIIPIFYSYQS